MVHARLHHHRPQGGVDVAAQTGLPSGVDVEAAATQAFDEPLTRQQVIAIVQPFFIRDLA